MLMDKLCLSIKYKGLIIMIKNKTELNYSGLYQNYNNYQIPISTNPLDYGILINKIDMKDSVVYFLHNEKGLTIVIRSYTDYNLIEFFKSGTSLIKFKDELMMNDNKFIRIIDNKKYYFENVEKFLLNSELKTKFIYKSKQYNLLLYNLHTTYFI